MKVVKIVLGVILGAYALIAAPGVVTGYRDYGPTGEGLGVAAVIVCLAALASIILIMSAMKSVDPPKKRNGGE